MAFQGTNFKSDQPTRLARKTLKITHADQHWRQVCREVDKRDGMICRATGVRLVKTLSVVPNRCEKHHIIPRSLGGPDEAWNVANLSLDAHQRVHVTRELHVSGNANKPLSFEEGGKRWKG